MYVEPIGQPISPAALRASTLRVGAVRVVDVRGEIDLSTSGELQDRLARAIRRGSAVVLDLCRCETMDSSGVRALRYARNMAHVRNARLVLACDPQSVTARLLSIVEEVEPFEIFRSRAEALASLAPAPRRAV